MASHWQVREIGVLEKRKTLGKQRVDCGVAIGIGENIEDHELPFYFCAGPRE
jgi:hypothetical protein